MDKAIKELADQAEQQQALGYETADSSQECTVCGDAAQFVSYRTLPLTGPLRLETCRACETDDGVFYHPEVAE